jgi:hypothetical protein
MVLYKHGGILYQKLNEKVQTQSKCSTPRVKMMLVMLFPGVWLPSGHRCETCHYCKYGTAQGHYHKMVPTAIHHDGVTRGCRGTHKLSMGMIRDILMYMVHPSAALQWR